MEESKKNKSGEGEEKEPDLSQPQPDTSETDKLEAQDINISDTDSKQPQDGSPDELDYEVMPDYEQNQDSTEAVSAKAEQEEIGEKSVTAAAKAANKSRGVRVWAISAAAALVIAVLAIIVYLLFFNQSEITGGDDINVNIPAGGEQGTEEPTDSDNDGLFDTQETELGTNPKKSDTDGDGLADGDEVNIYESDPLLVDTDSDTFEDGDEVKNGYSPVVNSPDKAGKEEISQWEERTAEFGLHQPTIDTLAEDVEPETESNLQVYQNDEFDYEFTVPDTIRVKPSEDNRILGLFILGSAEEAEVVDSQLQITTAVSAEGQTLTEWVDEFYNQGIDYAQSSEYERSSENGILLTDMPIENSDCPADRIIFKNDTDVVLITLVCNEHEELQQIFNQVAGSFKFTESK